jgi:predicted nucleic acid-binding Zn ribbon protein
MKYEKKVCASTDCPLKGKTFKPIRKDQKFCSQRCANREAQRDYRKRLVFREGEASA